MGYSECDECECSTEHPLDLLEGYILEISEEMREEWVKKEKLFDGEDEDMTKIFKYLPTKLTRSFFSAASAHVRLEQELEDYGTRHITTH